MLREMADAVRALTIERPLVLVLEDLHWSDCLARAGLALWCLGCPDQALEAFGTIDLMEARMFLGETYV